MRGHKNAIRQRNDRNLLGFCVSINTQKMFGSRYLKKESRLQNGRLTRRKNNNLHTSCDYWRQEIMTFILGQTKNLGDCFVCRTMNVY